MNYYKGLAVPENTAIETNYHYCAYTVERGFCKDICCSDCLYGNEENFKEWIAAGRPVEEEKNENRN